MDGSNAARCGLVILGIGTDLANIERVRRTFERFGPRFTHRVFTDAERAHAARRRDPVPAFAKRFAAKEAVLKALGTGLIEGFAWQQIEVTNDAAGRPEMTLHGKALSQLQAITPPGHVAAVHVSMTDDAPFAQAFVILEARPDPAA